MVKPVTRVSMVLMTGPLAPFGDAYRRYADVPERALLLWGDRSV